jgi:hypothetical protein
MKHETLDELIDRVAAGMTETTSTTMPPRWTAQSISRLQRRGGLPMLALMAGGITVVLSVTLWNWPIYEAALPDRGPVLAVRQLASFEPLRESVRPTSLPATPRSGRPETRMFRDDVTSPFAQAMADGTPPLLVDELDVSPLSSPDIAQIPALEIAPLDVPDLPASVINKESFQ